MYKEKVFQIKFFLKRNQTNNFHSLEYLPLSSSDTSLLLFENRNKS